MRSTETASVRTNRGAAIWGVNEVAGFVAAGLFPLAIRRMDQVTLRFCWALIFQIAQLPGFRMKEQALRVVTEFSRRTGLCRQKLVSIVQARNDHTWAIY